MIYSKWERAFVVLCSQLDIAYGMAECAVQCGDWVKYRQAMETVSRLHKMKRLIREKRPVDMPDGMLILTETGIAVT